MTLQIVLLIKTICDDFKPGRFTADFKKESTMKTEDRWLIAVVAFVIFFTASFGWGLWG